MTTETKISLILRKIWRHSGRFDEGGYAPGPYDEVDLPVTLDEADIIPDPVNDAPLHERIYREMEQRRQGLYHQEAAIVARINSEHENLASTRMAINSVEAAMVSLKTSPIVPARIEKLAPRSLAVIASGQDQ